MKNNCPNSSCSFFRKSDFIIKDGRFKRAGDSRYIQRYKCKCCLKKFSSSTNTLSYKQKKRRVNPVIFKLLASGVSMRRIAKLLNISRGTVDRRLEYFGKKSRIHNEKFRKNLKNKVTHLQFDDLITKENSKLKPLSISIAVDGNNRYILAAEVSQIPSFGLLAKKSVERYGKRTCHHTKGLRTMFDKIQICTHPESLIKSDEHKKYPPFVKEYFPRANYKRYTSERSCVAGQGELKKVKYDPIFAINHTCAMFRANINRLIRRTWCSTKDPLRLQDHIELFIHYFNTEIVKN